MELPGHKCASDYILKPLMLDDLVHKVRRVLQMRDLLKENRRLHAVIDQRKPDRLIIGDSHAVRDMMTLIDKVARTRSHRCVVDP